MMMMMAMEKYPRRERDSITSLEMHFFIFFGNASPPSLSVAVAVYRFIFLPRIKIPRGKRGGGGDALISLFQSPAI